MCSIADVALPDASVQSYQSQCKHYKKTAEEAFDIKPVETSKL